MPATQQHRWTEAEVRRLIDDAPSATPRLELVDGELLVTPSPSRAHQRVVLRLIRILDPFVLTNALGELCLSPSDLRLAPELVVQPDLFVIPAVNGRRPRLSDPITRLLLAVEVISPGSARFDRVATRRAYQAAQVPNTGSLIPTPERSSASREHGPSRRSCRSARVPQSSTS
jgi:Uma2 family endonuclease